MSKYRSVKTVVDGLTFDSKAEASHYGSLKLLQRSGVISGLSMQPRFPMVVEGKKICTYVADFSFLDRDGKLNIHDVKGVKTPVYRLKYKLFHALYPDLRITEITLSYIGG